MSRYPIIAQLLGHVRQCLDVVLAGAADVRNGLVLNLDASLTVVSDDVALDVGLTVLTIDENAIVRALLDLIAPDERTGERLIVVAQDLDAVRVRLRDLVVEQFRLVILNFHANLADLNLVLHDVRVDIQAGHDGRAAAEADLVALNLRHRGNTLHEDTGRLTTHDDVL